MNYEQITYDVSGPIATITLNRPEKLNAYTWIMGAEMRDALTQVEEDDNLRVTILTGAGRGFCAGADLTRGGDTFDYSKREKDPSAGTRPTGSLLKFYWGLKKPVIVAINGPAVGVGVTMILPLDIRIASESARMGIVFNRRGILPELACPWLLPRIIGISRAAELMYTGRILNAQESLEYGLVSRVVPDDQLLATARELAEEIAINSAPVSVALTRAMLWQFLCETDLDKIEEINHRYFAWTGLQPDAVEGVRSFLEKRTPNWSMKISEDMPDFFPIT